MSIYCANYLQTVLPNELSQFEFHLTLHCRLFDMLSLVFDAVGVAVFVVYHFELFCRPDTRNNVTQVSAKPNLNSTKNCLCISDGFKKLSDVDNIHI